MWNYLFSLLITKSENTMQVQLSPEQAHEGHQFCEIAKQMHIKKYLEKTLKSVGFFSSVKQLRAQIISNC